MQKFANKKSAVGLILQKKNKKFCPIAGQKLVQK